MDQRPTTIEAYAEKWDRNVDSNLARGCYEQNTLDDLVDSLNEDSANTDDMGSWDITDPQEWYDAMYAGLCEKARSLGFSMLYELEDGTPAVYGPNYAVVGYNDEGDKWYAKINYTWNAVLVADINVAYLDETGHRRI